jgi:hypothetical protein
MRRLELREIEINLYLAKKRFEKLASIYRKHPLDSERTPDDEENADIISFTENAIEKLNGALKDLDQIEERLDAIATKGRVS